jgi:hypothetical protein
MAGPSTCPICHRQTLSFHDTHRNNETDMGTGKPYFMCNDQKKCGLLVGVWGSDNLRGIFRKLSLANGTQTPN